MKRYIQKFDDESNLFDTEYFIDIVFNYGPRNSTIAASDRVKQPKIISDTNRLSQSQLNTYNDLVDSMLGPLVKRKFIINREWQSTRSYAYYVDFYPVDRQGNRFDNLVRIIFRAAEHDITHGEEGLVDEDLILKSFTLMGETYKDPFDLQRKVIDICEHLMDGDFMYVASVNT